VKFPLLTTIYAYDPHPLQEMGAEPVDILVFANHMVGKRMGWDYLKIKIKSGWLHVYPDAVLLFREGVSEGEYLWEEESDSEAVASEQAN